MAGALVTMRADYEEIKIKTTEDSNQCTALEETKESKQCRYTTTTAEPTVLELI